MEKILWFVFGMAAFAFLAVALNLQTEEMIVHSVSLIAIAGLLKFTKIGGHNIFFGMCAHAFIAGFSGELGILTFTPMINMGFGTGYIFAILYNMMADSR